MGQIIDISEVLLELGLSSSVTDEERAIANVSLSKAEGAIKRHLRYDPVQRERTEYYPQRDYDYQAAGAVWEVEGGQAVLRQVAGAATSELQIRHVPIRSVSDLRIDYDGRSGTSAGAFAAETTKTLGVDFWPNNDGRDSDGNEVCRDGILRSIGSWPTSPGSVRITYTAGYTAAELHGQDTIIDASPIAEAVMDEALRRARKIFLLKKKAAVGFVAGAFTSERLGDYSYSGEGSAASRLFSGGMDLLPETVQKLADFVNWGWDL